MAKKPNRKSKTAMRVSTSGVVVTTIKDAMTMAKGRHRSLAHLRESVETGLFVHWVTLT